MMAMQCVNARVAEYPQNAKLNLSVGTLNVTLELAMLDLTTHQYVNVLEEKHVENMPNAMNMVNVYVWKKEEHLQTVQPHAKKIALKGLPVLII